MKRTCKFCNGKLIPITVHICGTDEMGYKWVCQQCSLASFSEIRDYINYWIASEQFLRNRIREDCGYEV